MQRYANLSAQYTASSLHRLIMSDVSRAKHIPHGHLQLVRMRLELPTSIDKGHQVGVCDVNMPVSMNEMCAIGGEEC